MSVTIANKLPKSDQNGLAALEGALADDADGVTYVVSESDAVFTLLHALGTHPVWERHPTPDEVGDAVELLATRAAKALGVGLTAEEIATAAAALNRKGDGQ